MNPIDVYFKIKELKNDVALIIHTQCHMEASAAQDIANDIVDKVLGGLKDD